MAATKPGWTGTDIGGATGGTDSYSSSGGQELFTLTGKGTGMALAGDQMKFTSTNVSGDFQFTARLLLTSGSSGAQAGVALRQDFSGTCSYMAAASFVSNVNSQVSGQPGYVKNRPNSLGLYVRKTPLVGNTWFSVLNPTDMPVPAGSGKYCWLRIIRKGNDVSMYRACADNSVTDLTTKWSPVYNTSGGAFLVSGTVPVQIGLFVATGTSSQPITAVFDQVSLETATPLTLPFRTSWLGNDSEADSTSYVSANAKAMWVSPDGKCYVNGAGDEAGQSAKIYQWSGTGLIGKVVKRFDNPPSGGGWEGSIAGNYVSSGVGNVFLTGQLGICMTDLNGSNPKKIYIPNQTVVNNLAQISGMAWGNGMLYVSNPADGRIYLSGTSQPSWVGTQSVVMSNLAYTGTDGLLGTINNTGTGTYVVDQPAPQEVYQTQFRAPSMTFNISGLPTTPGQEFLVRLHFAEFGETPRTQRLMNISINVTGTSVTNYRIAAAHGEGIANILEFPHVKLNTSNQIKITLNSATSGEMAVINGIEITWPTGSQTYNCGGPTVGSWLGSTCEVGSFSGTSFGVTRPGPLAVDKRGNLWVVQEGAPFPTSDGRFDGPVGQASVVCFSGSAPYTYLGKIPGLTNPTAICFDQSGTNDRLLVTENGEDQNIRIYTNLTGTAPTWSGTFGAVKGVFSGSSQAGQVYVPADHGYARFYGPTGVGVDQSGQVYVVCNPGANVTDLKAFASTDNETLLWKMQGMEFCNVGDFDGAIDASSIWTPSFHYAMNYNATTPGGEWQLKSYMWNPFLITGTTPEAISAKTEPRSAATSAVYRKISGKGFIFTCGQGALIASLTINGVTKPYGVDVFRFKGSTEQLVRCAELTWMGHYLCYWRDTDGNGVEEAAPDAGSLGDQLIPDRTKDGSPQNDPARRAPDIYTNDLPRSFDVDGDGNIYLAVGGTSHTPYVFKVAISGLDTNGTPIYDPPSLSLLSSYKTYLPSTSYFTQNSWGGRSHLRYVGGPEDLMYLEGDRDPNAGSRTDDSKGNYGGVLECWKNWSTSPSLKYPAVTLPDPGSEPNFINGAPPYTQVDGFCYEAMDVANGYTFISDNWGSIQVVGPTGTIVAKLYAGPEVSGISGWTDAIMGLRAHYNSLTNEYYILQECAGFRQRQNFYRWKPPGS